MKEGDAKSAIAYVSTKKDVDLMFYFKYAFMMKDD